MSGLAGFFLGMFATILGYYLAVKWHRRRTRRQMEAWRERFKPSVYDGDTADK
jgi:hypothetical protein